MPLRWFRVRPLLGSRERVLPVLGLGFVLEYHRSEDRLEIYYLSEASRVSFNRVAAAEEKAPPELPPYGYEVRIRGKEWWLPVEVRDWHGLLEAMGPGTVVQVVALRDYKLKEKLLKKAESLKEGREYTAGRVLASVLLGESVFNVKRDEQLAQELRRRAQSVWQLAFRVYAGSEEKARELAEQLIARLLVDDEKHWRLERIKVKKSKDMARLRDPLRLKKGDTSRPWLPEDRLKAVLELPEPSSPLPVDFAHRAGLPSIAPRRSEIRIGVLHDGREVRIDVDDLYRHAYVIGSTGAGKSTFLLNLVLRLWETGRGAVFVIDPHGDLVRDILERVPSLERVYYLDARRRDFAVNPLVPPPIPDRELARAVAVDNTVKVMEKVLRLPETAVNVKFIVRTLLQVLYARGGVPTFEQLFEAVLALYGGELELDLGDERLDRVWRAQVELLRNIQEQSFLSTLVRLQPFATHPLLRDLTSEDTLPVERLVEERALVLFNVPKDLGEEFSELLTSLIVMKLWFFAAARREARERGMDVPMVPVFLVVDEFQNLSGLPVLETMLSEARKYGLHVIAAHQHTRQLPEELLRSLFSNTALKVVFSVEGPDVDRLKSIDPRFAEALEELLPSLATGMAVVRIRGGPGEERYPPILVRTDPAPPKRRELEEARGRLPRFPPRGAVSRPVEELLNPVLRYLPRERLSPVEQLVLYHVYVLSRGSSDGWAQWSDVRMRLGLPPKRAEAARDQLAARGLVEVRREGNRLLLRYRGGLFAGLRQVAPSDEGWRLAVAAVLYYLEHGYYVAPARQDPGLSAKPDLVAIPFDKAGLALRYSQAVAVEVETCNELSTHPEQVARNIEKHGSTPFVEVHLWFPKKCLADMQRPFGAARKPKPVKLFPVSFTGRRAVLLEAALEEISGGGGAASPAAPGAGVEAVEGAEAGDVGEVLGEAPGGEEAGPVEEAGEGSPGLHGGPAGSLKEPVEDHAGAGEAGAGVEGEHEEPQRGQPSVEDLRGLLEAQARMLAALGETVRGLAEAQARQTETLQKLAENMDRVTQLLAGLMERLDRLEAAAQQHGATPETRGSAAQPHGPRPAREERGATQPRETPETPRGEAQETPPEPQGLEYDPEQDCYWITLDQPPGHRVCLPGDKAREAQEFRRRGYRLVARGNWLYARRTGYTRPLTQLPQNQQPSPTPETRHTGQPTAQTHPYRVKPGAARGGDDPPPA
ncbi:hypothetical protein Pyrde_0708 [Pyrodictium delaneyi]|uniref:Uncharacterized protein n=1 Tax=Pyrodictium delaneyi TaxID=1273541 RepID=A0A0P0N2N2_9CREN|nr:ATP-binding protein [Pyrodictium delaneyi]ALL00758.1 hypothetical protein Pyrde_0708 [Pyrodictium delaneyi]